MDVRQLEPACYSEGFGCAYRTLWVWIDESEENRQRYVDARINQDEMFRIKIDEVFELMMHVDRHKISDNLRKLL